MAEYCESPTPAGVKLPALAGDDCDVSLVGIPRTLRRISGWLFYGSFITVPVAVGGALGTLAIAGRAVPSRAVIAVAVGAFLAYVLERNLIRSEGDRANHQGRSAWGDDRRGLLNWLAGICFAVLTVLTTLLSLRSALLVVAMGGLVVLYFGLRNARLSDRTSAILKSVLVAAAWAIGVAALPLCEAGSAASVIIPLTIYRFVYVLPAVVLPDIADVYGDRLTGRHTIASLVGVERLPRYIVIAIVAFSFVVIVVATVAARRLFVIDLVGLWMVGLCLRCGAGRDPKFVTRTVDVFAIWPVVTYVSHLAF